MSAADLTALVDACTGQARVAETLLHRAGIGGLDLSLVAAYDGGTLATATASNQDAPTGILGLGWSIGRDRIVVAHGQSMLPGDAGYTIELNGIRSPLVCTGTDGAGVSSWALTHYRFWQIRSDPRRDAWTVIDEDGTTYLFGDAASGRGTVDWGVGWGGWSAASGAIQGQAAVATAWSLASVADRFGNRLTYSYLQDIAPVAASGGLTYTRASYLVSIVGVDGAVMTLSYGDKTAAEYQAPHAAPAPPNGWQDRYQTRYLGGAAIADAAGGAVASISLGYALDLGSGGMVKRTLASIERLSAAGEVKEPATLFSYYGENGGDGVTATAVSSGAALYGAMKAVTLPGGGSLLYAYQAAALDYADRSLAITAPTGWSDPQIYAGDDCMMVTWLDGTTVHVMSYVWEGRWVGAEAMQVPLGATAYAGLQLADAAGVCAVRAGGTVMVAARDPARPGAWFPAGSFTITPAIGAGETATLACGNGFAAVMGITGGDLLTFRFTGAGIGAATTASGWIADAPVSLGAAGAGFAMAAEGAVLATVTAPASGGATLRLVTRAPDGDWSPPSTAALAGLGAAAMSLQCGEGFAIAASFAPAPGGLIGTAVACWWDRAGTTIVAQPWPAVFATTASPPTIAGATVVVGQTAYRFTGAGWASFALNSVSYAGAIGAPVLSVGADMIARRFTTSAGGAIADLLTYCPATATWSVPAGLSVTGAGALAAVAAETRTAVGSYAVVGTQLWFRAATGGWSAVARLPAAMSAADMATIRLVGDAYLVFQTGTGTSSVTTLAYLLANGAATAAPTPPAAGQQIALPGGSVGATVGRSGFATFAGSFGAGTAPLTLHRPVFGDVGGAQTGYSVASVTSDNGYAAESGINGIVATALAYQAGTIDRGGTVPSYNMVTAVPGQTATAAPANGTLILAYYTGLTATEAPAAPYPTDAGNAASCTLAMRGALYQSTATATGTGSSQTTVARTTLCHEVTPLPLGTAAIGAYHRIVQQALTRDGVTGTDQFDWDPASGFARSKSTQIVNAAGTIDGFSERYTYFYEQYDVSRSLNLLSPVVQRLQQSQPAGTSAAATVAIDVVAWRDWAGSGQWAQERAYRGLSAGATFAAWASGETPPGSDFVLVSQVMARAATGVPIETIDAHGVRASTIYDRDARLPVAAAANCPAGQCAWYGCEPYEAAGPWASNVPGGSIADYLTTASYHTGTRGLALPANSARTGPLLAVVPADQGRRCLFSCWARTDPAFAPGDGIAQWTITLYNPATLAAVGNPIALVLTPAAAAMSSAIGGWAYFQVTIDLPALVAASGLAALGLAIQATNANAALPCYLDELRFMPLDCGFEAQVHAPSSLLPTATVDANGRSIQIFYDKRDAPYLAIGPDGSVRALEIATSSRWQAGTSGFLDAFPNVTLALGSAVASVYYDFHDGSTADWNFTTAADWAIAGSLSFSGHASDDATCALLAAPNQAARVSVAMGGAAGASAALGNGKYRMRWTNPQGTGTGIWTLEDGASSTALATNAVAPFDPEWLFAVIDGAVIAYAGSTQLFAFVPSIAPVLDAPGHITLTATAPTSFDDLVILQDPWFTLTASDGLGQPFTRLSLIGYQPVGGNVLFPGQWAISASHLFYDAVGRPYLAGQALEAPLQIAPPQSGGGYSLIAADQGSYLYTGTGTALTVPDYLSGTDGRTFSETGYQPSPLTRAVALDLPRASYAAGTYYCTRQTIYGSATTVDGAPAAGAGSYRLRLVQALLQDSAAPSASAPAVTVLEQTTTDAAGRILMTQSGPAGGTMLRTGYGYDAAGRLATIAHPNCHAPPAGSVAADWQETLSYDFLGQCTARTAPDSGTMQCAYDSLGRPRFVSRAGGAPVGSGAATILYWKYDALGRVVEAGAIADGRYAWGNAALTAMLDVAAFPIIAASPSGPDEALGAVSQANVFDTDVVFTGGASFTPNLVGRMAATATTPSDGATAQDHERYAYDASGNVVAKTLVMPGISPAAGWTTAIAYNRAGQPLSIVYPNMLTTAADPAAGGPPVTVGHGYDRLGRLAAVGGQSSGAVIDPAHPPLAQDMSYAGYSYDSFGNLLAASYNNAGGATGAPIPRGFSYDGSRRLVATTSPFFDESLSYECGAGLTGWSYFNAQVTQASASYPGGATMPAPPAPVSQQFAYDGYGRLASAVSSLGAGDSLAMGAGGAAYDANGNIQGKTIGASAIAFVYTPPSGASMSNRVTGLTTTASATVDFTQATPAPNGWSYGSSNGGPSSSGLTTTTPVAGTGQALKLAGGSETHYEQLRLSSFLTPGVSYTLSWSAATDPGYPATPGGAIDGAAWFAVLLGAGGPLAALPLATVAPASAWTPGTAAIDLTPPALARIIGDGVEVVGVAVELRNRCLGANGGPGPAVYVTTAGVAAAGAPAVAAAYGYDANGNVTSSSGRGLGAITYDAVTQLTASISIAGAGGNATLAIAYGADRRRSRATLTPSGGGTPARTVSLTAPDGTLLATQQTTGGAVSATYYLNGAQGPFARLTDTAALGYILQDRLGGTRAVIDGPSATPVATRDYGAFGDTQRASGEGGTDIAYTGQRLDAATGLYNYNARLYDPLLGRFYAADPAGEYPSPYQYVGNDPVNATDPSGAVSRRWHIAAWAISLYTNPAEVYWVLRGILGWPTSFFAESDTDPWYAKPLLFLKIPGLTFKNVSWREVGVIVFYPYEKWPSVLNNPLVQRLIYPVRFTVTAFSVYRRITKDTSDPGSWADPPAGAGYGKFEMANAARHFSFMCRNLRMRFGSPGYAKALGDAHEAPSTEEYAIFDAVSDKLNNLITIYLTETQPDVDCVELFKRNWGSGPGIFSLSGEKQNLNMTSVRAGRLASFMTSIDYLERVGRWQTDSSLPDFTPEERELLMPLLDDDGMTMLNPRWP